MQTVDAGTAFADLDTLGEAQALAEGVGAPVTAHPAAVVRITITEA
ncbi:hypothetical protein [Blastococcus sp. VKM Ac-2987]|nr:hypothetical protein [Blastococcus sp. VKM Ac-2987]MCZ2857838.1 hypothetical protein [Blastococcus sp. VKM Ac-2987]